MRLTVLRPVPVAERCYLSEALLWAAVQRFPLQEVGNDGIDERLDPDYPDGLESPELMPLTDTECSRAGISLNPSWEEFLSSEWHLQPKYLAEIIKTVDPQIPGHEKFLADTRRDLAQSKVFHRRRLKWEQEFEGFIDIYRAKIFLALREGRLTAVAKKLPRRTVESSFAYLQSLNWEGWDKTAWEPVPAQFWLSESIDWDNSLSEGQREAFCMIQVETSRLMELFPPPPAEPSQGVVTIGEEYVLVAEHQIVKPLSRRGRPSFRWDEFHVEIARRVGMGTLPRKQEALIVEMQNWCMDRWGRQVGRSTLLQKLKPYYDGLLRLPPSATP